MFLDSAKAVHVYGGWSVLRCTGKVTTTVLCRAMLCIDVCGSSAILLAVHLAKTTIETLQCTSRKT